MVRSREPSVSVKGRRSRSTLASLCLARIDLSLAFGSVRATAKVAPWPGRTTLWCSRQQLGEGPVCCCAAPLEEPCNADESARAHRGHILGFAGLPPDKVYGLAVAHRPNDAGNGALINALANVVRAGWLVRSCPMIGRPHGRSQSRRSAISHRRPRAYVLPSGAVRRRVERGSERVRRTRPLRRALSRYVPRQFRVVT